MLLLGIFYMLLLACRICLGIVLNQFDNTVNIVVRDCNRVVLPYGVKQIASVNNPMVKHVDFNGRRVVENYNWNDWNIPIVFQESS